RRASSPRWLSRQRKKNSAQSGPAIRNAPSLLARGLLGPPFGARFGELARLGHQNHGALGFAAAVAADPRDPVRSACLAVNSIRARRRRHVGPKSTRFGAISR